MRKLFASTLLAFVMLAFVAVPAMAVEMVSFHITWTDTNTDETGYRYELKDNSDPANPWVVRIEDIDPSILFADDLVEVGKEWCVRITAKRSVDGAEAVSMEQCLVAQTELDPLNPPDPVVVTQPGAGA